MIAHHALVLNLHQPPDNLWNLLNDGNWEAKEILYALDRIPRSLWGLEDVARVHLSLSGTLLETLNDPGFQQRVYGVVDCDSPRFQGFWPPEMDFSMELIPLLRSFDYRYVLVDSEHVEPVTPMSWQELRYRPHIARHGEDEIVVIVRDRDLSNAQEAGMDVDWFDNEVAERTKWCDFVPLVTTCTDGENGGWFRNTTAGTNFWSAFYLPLLERVRGIPDLHQRLLEYARRPRRGTGSHRGLEHRLAQRTRFTQWTGSDRQRTVLGAIETLSAAVQETARQAAKQGIADDAGFQQDLEEATWRLLRAETSCNFYWGEDWAHRSDADMAASWEALNHARAWDEVLVGWAKQAPGKMDARFQPFHRGFRTVAEPEIVPQQ